MSPLSYYMIVFFWTSWWLLEMAELFEEIIFGFVILAAVLDIITIIGIRVVVCVLDEGGMEGISFVRKYRNI